MYRSFTDRVFGGVCGGIAAPLPVNAWAIRLIFAGVAAATLGAGAVLYLMLWVAVPQASLARRQTGGFGWGVLIFGLSVIVLAGWVARLYGFTRTPTGTDLYYPVLALILSVIYFSQQFRRMV